MRGATNEPVPLGVLLGLVIGAATAPHQTDTGELNRMAIAAAVSWPKSVHSENKTEPIAPSDLRSRQTPGSQV